MKKLKLLFIILLLSTLASHAQFSRSVRDNQHDRLINTLLSLSGKKAANKTTTASQRLVSTSHYGYDAYYGSWHRGDTTAYKYTGGRVSEYDFNSMNFLSFRYQYNSGPSGVDMGLVQVVSKNYANKPMLQYSSAKTWDGNSSINDTSHIEYNANNDVTYYSDTSLSYTPGGWGKAYNQYDAAGRIILSMSVRNSTYQNDTVLRYYFYNSAGDLVRDSTLSFSFGYSYVATKNEYSYNSAGNISQIKYFVQSYPNWYEMNRYTLSYYSSLQLKKVTKYDIAYGDYYQVDSFGWTSGVDYYTYHQAKIVIYDTFVNSKYIETKNVSTVTLLPDSVTYSNYSFGGSHPDSTIWKCTFEYDSYGMPIRRDEYVYNPAYITADSLVFTSYYYYKPNTTGVTTAQSEASHISIFPNPTSGIFTLQLPALTDEAEITISDFTGKVVLTKSINNTNLPTVNLSGNPPGNYIVRVTSGDQTFLDKIVLW